MPINAIENYDQFGCWRRYEGIETRPPVGGEDWGGRVSLAASPVGSAQGDPNALIRAHEPWAKNLSTWPAARGTLQSDRVSEGKALEHLDRYVSIPGPRVGGKLTDRAAALRSRAVKSDYGRVERGAFTVIAGGRWCSITSNANAKTCR